MSFLNWDEYLAAKGNFTDCRRKCYDSFARQRERIRNLYSALSPRKVVCMGSGYLNDIPIEDFVAAGSSIFLVDWIKNLSREAFVCDVVKESEESYQCIVCSARGDPHRFCLNYEDPDVSHQDLKPQLCSQFYPSKGSLPHCENFKFGADPSFIEADATHGRAGTFARKILQLLPNAKNPKSVFKNALREVRQLKNVSQPLPIEDRSVDFVTSSMVVSQFEFEPMGFLSQNLALKFGTEELQRLEKNLNPYMEELRDNLFLSLVEGHFKEIHRILKEDGRVYFSHEAFHRSEDSSGWFWVRNFAMTMEIIGKYFRFDFDTLPGLCEPDRVEILGGESIIPSYVLVPISVQ